MAMCFGCMSPPVHLLLVEAFDLQVLARPRRNFQSLLLLVALLHGLRQYTTFVSLV